LALIDLIEERGARADYHDPHVPVVPPTREHASLTGRRSVPLDLNHIQAYDAVLIATDHEAIDYPALVRGARLVVDTRNACARAGLVGDHILKA
jgi:UDP-N-acetyl-D-glucosamine dehydrogenase